EGSRQGIMREIELMVSAGNLDGAVERMRLLADLNGTKRFLADPQFRAVWRTLLVQQAVAAPESDPNRWDEVNALIEYLNKQKDYGGVEKVVSEANILYLQGKKSAAGRMLRDAIRGDYAKDLRVWVAWINMYQKERPGEQTLAQIDLAQKSLGDIVPIRLLRLSHALGQANENQSAVIDTLQQISKTTDQFSKNDQVRLLKGVAAAYLRVGDTVKAQSIYEEISSLAPNDPAVLNQRFNLALATNDDAGMDAAVEAIGKLFGTKSAQYKHMQASKIISRVARKEDDVERLEEASVLLKEAKENRPKWHEIARLQGEIAWSERRFDDALSHYETAVAQGSRHVMVLRRLARLLHASGRHDEALTKLSLLGEEQKAGLTRIEAQSYSMTGDPTRALAMAKEAIEKGKDDWSNHLWYGQLLQRAERHDEAEKHLRRAVELKPDQPGNWVTLVAHLAKNDKRGDAEDAIRQVEATLPENVAPAILAQCYELLGKKDRAEKYYRQLHQIDPENTATNRVIAQFYLRNGDLPSGQKYLANIMKQSDKKDDPNVFWARRALAELKAKQGTYRDTILALKLLDANELDGKQQPTDKKLRAQLLASRPERSSRLQAIRLFEELRDEKQLSNDQVFTLAKLYLATNNFDAFSQTMQGLPLNDNQQYLAAYVDALVTHDRLKQAAPLLRRLESIDANLPSAVALRARMLNEYGKTDEAVTLLKRIVPDTLGVKKLGLLPQVAKLMEDFGRPDEAEVLYRRFEREHPAGVLARAAFLGRQGDFDQAFQLLSASKNKLAMPAVIQVGLSMLQNQRQKDHETKFDPKYFQALESWFAQAEGKQPGSLRVAVLLPQLRTLQGRLDETMNLYEELLERDDLTPLQRAMFLNNLAFMNAIRNQNLPESREMIEEAINILGPNSDLLDTRAVTLIGHDNSKAIDDLEAAIAEKPDAIKYFHLALVHLNANDLRAARASFAQANEKGFDIDELDPAERGKYDQLVEALKKKPKEKSGFNRAA
ncbi:MAG: tetratricopeptide repeat protein, partial [Pirellulales bacterium]|nr:tetratricopeptide repeat protein [Pirellulales bacterium]